MVEVIIVSSLGLFFWILTIFTFKGVDWILINGVNMSSKEEKQKFKEKHDMITMNRYIGKQVFLPIAVLFSLIVPLILFDAEWMQSAWFGVVILFAIIAFLVLLVRAALKILDFDKWRK